MTAFLKNFSNFRTQLITSLLLFTITAALPLACVTVNVNFPESAVQKATDDYVKELYRNREKKREAPTVTITPAAAATSWIMDWMPSAYAADDLFKVDSSEARSIMKSLQSRVDEVIQYKQSGNFGESKAGQLVLKDKKGLKPLQLKHLESLIQAENKDRATLYREVLKTNGLPDSRLVNVERSFARSFQAESPSGTWVEDADGNWTQKR